MQIRLHKTDSRLPSAAEAWSMFFLLGAAIYVPLALSGASGVLPSQGGFVGPFRGGTRAIGCLFSGRFAEAIAFSPLALVFIVILAALTLRWLLFVLPGFRRPRLATTTTERTTLYAIAVLAGAAGWAYAVMSKQYLVPY